MTHLVGGVIFTLFKMMPFRGEVVVSLDADGGVEVSRNLRVWLRKDTSIHTSVITAPTAYIYRPDPTRPQTTQTNSMVCDDHGKKIKANREKNGHQLQLQFHALQLNINIAIIKSTPVHSHNVRQCAATRCASNSKSPPCTPAAHPPLGCPESRWAGSHPRKCAHRAETCCYET